MRPVAAKLCSSAMLCSKSHCPYASGRAALCLHVIVVNNSRSGPFAVDDSAIQGEGLILKLVTNAPLLSSFADHSPDMFKALSRLRKTYSVQFNLELGFRDVFACLVA